MQGVAFDMSIWVLWAVSIAISAFILVLVWRGGRRPGAMRDLWLYSRRGAVITQSVLTLVLILLFGLVMGAVAIRYAFLWSTVVMLASFGAAVVVTLVRYLSYDPRELLDEPDEDDGEPSDSL